MMLINGLGMMLGVGVSVVAAIHLSKGNNKAARINVTQAFGAGVFISIVIGSVCYLFPGTVLNLLGVEGSLYAPTREYYLWFLPTCLLLMICHPSRRLATLCHVLQHHPCHHQRGA